MKKKLVSVLLAGVMTVGMLAGCGSSKGESTGKSKDYDLTLYSVMTTDPDFDEWLKNVEDATGLNINVIAAPTDPIPVSRKLRQSYLQEMLLLILSKSMMR